MIDSWSNLTNIGQIAGKNSWNYLNSSASAQNHLSGYDYDAAGNIRKDISGDSLTYDARPDIIDLGSSDSRLSQMGSLQEVFERQAYRTQSYVSQEAGSESIVWNRSWAVSADTELLRQKAVKQAAQGSVEASRQEYEGGKK